MASVVLLQPDPQVALRLRALIEAAPGLQVVDIATNVYRASHALAQHHPDVLVTDLQLPEGPVCRGLHRLAGTRVVVIALSVDDERLMDALRCGVDGYFVPGRSPSLVAVIDQVLHGEATITPQIAREVRAHFDMRAFDATDTEPGALDESDAALADSRRLTESERLLLQWTCEGFLPGEIARALQQTVHGVGVRIRSIYRKLQMDVRAGVMSAQG